MSFGILEGEEKEGRAGKIIEEIMTENFPNLAKGINLQSHETHQISNNINLKKSMPNIPRGQVQTKPEHYQV